jgi:hypothetical protein
MSIAKLNPMEKVSLLFVNYLDHRISSLINNANNIPICLHTIYNEPLENGRTQPFPFNNCIQLPPQNALSFRVLGLHVIDRNHHDLPIDRVINVIGHGRPSLNMFYMIKHHPHILQMSLGYICQTRSNLDVIPSTNILNK